VGPLSYRMDGSVPVVVVLSIAFVCEAQASASRVRRVCVIDCRSWGVKLSGISSRVIAARWSRQSTRNSGGCGGGGTGPPKQAVGWWDHRSQGDPVALGLTRSFSLLPIVVNKVVDR
jgi:hypothetical protein